MTVGVAGMTVEGAAMKDGEERQEGRFPALVIRPVLHYSIANPPVRMD